MANMYILLADYCIRTSMFNLFYLSCLCIVYSGCYNVNDPLLCPTFHIKWLISIQMLASKQVNRVRYEVNHLKQRLQYYKCRNNITEAAAL